MISRMVKVQLVIFSVLTVVTASVIVFVYADLPAKYGWWDQNYVTATFEEGAGIYTSGNVTYRGVGEVGEVTDIDLNPKGGVDVKLRYDSDLDVPANVRAEIHAVSAVGEFYVDLVPPAEPSADNLKDGDHIPIERTSVPLAIAPVLTDVNNFLQSIPQESLSAFMTEAADAFDGLGPEMLKLITNAQRLVDEANTNYEATSNLLRDFPPLFDTQNQISDSVRGWASNLAAFTDTLAQSDPALDVILADRGQRGAGDAVQAADGTLRSVVPIMPTFLSNVEVSGQLFSTYRDGLESLFQTLPLAAARFQQITRTPGTVYVNINSGLGNPPGCSIGYPQVGHPLSTRNPFDLRDYPFIKGENTYCKVAPEDPRAVRGARNYRCFEGPPGARAASAQKCREGGYTPDDALDKEPLQLLKIPGVGGQAASSIATDAAVRGPSGATVIGNAAAASPSRWQGLLLADGGKWR